MRFGNVDINPEGWGKWNFEQFKEFHDQSLKGKVTETPEEVFTALGGKVPVKPKKSDKEE